MLGTGTGEGPGWALCQMGLGSGTVLRNQVQECMDQDWRVPGSGVLSALSWRCHPVLFGQFRVSCPVYSSPQLLPLTYCTQSGTRGLAMPLAVTLPISILTTRSSCWLHKPPLKNRKCLTEQRLSWEVTALNSISSDLAQIKSIWIVSSSTSSVDVEDEARCKEPTAKKQWSPLSKLTSPKEWRALQCCGHKDKLSQLHHKAHHQ